MAFNRFDHYFRRYFTILSEAGIKEANRRGVNTLMTHTLNRVMSLISPFEKEFNLPERLLFIESTDQMNGWGLGDGIFKTGMITDLGKTDGISLDIVTHSSRGAIFSRNPYIKNIYQVNDFKDSLALASRLREKNYGGILLIYPDWQMLLMKLIIAADSKSLYEKKNYDFGTKNHIEMYREIARNKIPNIARGDGRTLLMLSDEEVSLAKKKISRIPGKSYIGINIGAKCALRNFKNWNEVIGKLNFQFKDDIHFVLYGKDNSSGLDESLEKQYPNVTNLVGKTSDLRHLYAIMNEMDLNIGADGGNINASIAMGKSTLPIYSVVCGKERLPEDFPNKNIIQGSCEKGSCYTTSMGMSCEITNQKYEQHELTPPCLSNQNLIDEIVEKTINNLFRSI